MIYRVAEISRHDQRLAQRRTRGYLRAPAVEEASEPARRVNHLADRGQIYRSYHRIAFDLQPDHHAVERHAAHERVGAVDRIDDPASARRSGALAGFLADDRVVGKALHDTVAQVGLGFAIGNRDGGAVGLAIDLERAAKMAQRQLARAARDIDREIGQRL